MKQISIKKVQICLIATMLLILGTVSAHAQYYFLNVYQKDGAKVEYMISALDSINITEKIPTISLNYTTLSLVTGKQSQLNASVKLGSTTLNVPVSWSSDNNDVATVNETGKVTAISTGTATITVASEGQTATCLVTVTEPVEGRIKVNYYGCRILSDHVDINIFAENQLVEANGYGINTLKKNWQSAVCYIGDNKYELDATDGASFRSDSYGKYYWTWAFINTTVKNALSKASETNPVKIIMTDVEGAQYIFIFIMPQTNSKSYYKYCEEDNGEENEEDNGEFEYVDLGLSVKWAICNVGASKPEEYGDYYAWGETEPKTSYTWTNYKFRTSGDSWDNVKFSKYNTSSSYGTVDNKTVLDPEDDVAHVKWGGSWRLPTKEEQDDLRNKCTWTWYSSGNTEFNGVAGYKVTSNVSGYTDRSIFLPAAGCRVADLGDVGSYGNYWSSSLYTDVPVNAWNVYFDSGNHITDNYYRDYGRSVRPVCPSEEWLNAVSITLNSNLVSIVMGNTITLSATVKQGNEVIDREVTWISDNPSIASVSETGVVTAIAVGSTTITAICMGKTATCTITVIEPQYENRYEYVDLGLSVKWATFNVGATKPEEYGDYYAWGETEPKTQYYWSTYKWCNGSSSTLTKYNTKSSNGTVDNKTTLDPEDDVAHVKWGGSWRIPTIEELNELRNRNSCTWTWYSSGNSEFNGVAGYKITSNKSGYTDRFIFLPAAGYRLDTSLGNAGEVGYYWSSSLVTGYPNLAQFLGFYSGYHYADYFSRDYGQSVRPVCPSEEWLNAVSITLNSNLDSIVMGNTITLSATVKHGNEVIDREVTWISDNPSIASVSETGVVTAIAVGSTTITAICMGKTATCTITVIEPQENGYEYVDLGLSVKWATFNVGATKPEKYGDYYAWGETEPYYEVGYAQESPQAHWKDGYSAGYGWSNYKWCNGSNSTLTKYNTTSYGTIDNKTTLDPEDDVAHVKWGGSWRMPTKEELNELSNSCTWTWYNRGNTEFNGVAGYKVTSNKSGYTDRSIFLPAAKFRYDTSLDYARERGDYWSSSLRTDNPLSAQSLYFDSGSHVTAGSDARSYGQSVRPVCPSEEWLNAVSITLNSNLDSIVMGNTITLSATVKHGNEVIDREVTWISDNPSIASVSETGVVTAITVGSTTITAICMGKTATCTITVIEPQYEYVDLGLSVKWATFNVGATKPEEYGDYYAWGETEPYYEVGYAQERPQAHWKDGYSAGYGWSNYKWCNGSYSTFTKYNTSTSYGTVDNKTTLDPEDDVAHVKWGGSWRIPTTEEQEELLNSCTWTWYSSGNSEFNGVAGYKVTSNVDGYTDRFIFLPTAGYRGDTSMDDLGVCGDYWSSSLFTDSPHCAQYLYFFSGYHDTYFNYRYRGLSVRPVCP